MRISTAQVPTENASSYLRKLCQHWSHKFAVNFNDQHGKIELPAATCILNAAADRLDVRLELKQEADQSRLEKVVEEHIQRFGFRETLVFAWSATEVQGLAAL